MISRTEILEREKRWTLVAGIAAVMGVAIILATYGDSAAAVRAGAGLAERLGEVDGDRSSLMIASIGQFLGWSLLAVPLVFLFRAAAARSPRVRPALVGVMILAPVLLGVGGILSAGSILQAATDFKDVDQAAIEKCVSDKVADDSDGKVSDDERASLQTDCEDEEARDVRAGTALAPLETGIGLAGLLGFTVSVIYASLWGMRTGLLTRFWGSLGIALGAVFAFFTLFTLIWFIYLGLLLAGWVPGGRPKAWGAGEAVPWPKPGDSIPGDAVDAGGAGDGVIDGTADEVEVSAGDLGPGDPDDPGQSGAGQPGPDQSGAGESAESGDESQGERRKRKKRS